LSDNELDSYPLEMIDKNYQVEGDLRREVTLNIKKKKDIRNL
jgi:small subunit ribosomal protein S13